MAQNRVAIASQGGGSHTAFTARVLQALLASFPARPPLGSLSGTSGGAICAALAWDGLVRGNPQQGIDKLQSFWHAMAATEPWDQLANHTLMSMMSARDLMVLPEVSPYHVPPWGDEYL